MPLFLFFLDPGDDPVVIFFNNRNILRKQPQTGKAEDPSLDKRDQAGYGS